MPDVATDTPASLPGDTHPVQMLLAQVDSFRSYPTGVVRIWEHPKDTGFFPGNAGLWNMAADKPLPPWPRDGVMIVGHNYNCEASFRWALREPRPPKIEDRWPAFRWLRELVECAGIQLHDCFFTNFFIGLKEGDQPNGPFPGRHDAVFVGWCRSLLLEEIRLQQPRLLLTLGSAVLPYLAQLEPLHRWSGAMSLRTLDERGTALVSGVQFVGSSHPTTVVALTHPSLWPVNVRHRRYGPHCGAAAEHELLRDGVTSSHYIATPPQASSATAAAGARSRSLCRPR